jgi:tyrosine-protein kinase Etk/Wzc
VGAGTSSDKPTELFAGARWSEFIEWCKQSFSMIIVDAPPVLSLADAELIGAGCDATLMVVRALSTPRELVQKCAARLDKKKLIGIVFNGLPRGPENPYGYYGAANGNHKG